jgi:hypothetical protein
MSGFRTNVRRRLVRFLRPSPVLVCEFNAWGGYLINAARPDAIRVRLYPGERADRLLAAVPAAARVLLMHIDLSETAGFLTHEADFLAGLAERGITVLNARAVDIRKRTMHAQCEARGLPSARTGREGPPDEQVIIKTDLNCGGVPEQRLIAHGLHVQSAVPLALLSRGDTGYPEYPVCRRDEVPEAAWSDPTLVVERFIDNPEGVYFRVYALGRATVVAEAWSDEKIKKLNGPIRKRVNHFFWFEDGTPVPLGEANARVTRAATIARQVGAALDVDFHASDCVMSGDGEIVAVDINKTPWWGPQVRPGVIEHLRRGLDGLIAEVD